MQPTFNFEIIYLAHELFQFETRRLGYGQHDLGLNSQQMQVTFILRSPLFWGITQRRVVIFYQHFGTTYWSHVQGPRCPRIFFDLTLENGTDTLSQNISKGLPLDAALYPRKVQFPSASRQKPEIKHNFYLPQTFRLVLGVSQPPPVVPWALSSPPSSAHIKKECSYTSI
jgi:hypothetical protein